MPLGARAEYARRSRTSKTCCGSTPNDNQGIRYELASWYLLLDRDEDSGRRLLEAFDEDTSEQAWTYGQGARSLPPLMATTMQKAGRTAREGPRVEPLRVRNTKCLARRDAAS